MVDRALSFGSVAAAYERFRPGYPDELVDEVLSYAGRPVRTALEIGAGTGKATRAFARRGVAVTATDPDAGMLAELRRHVPGTVTVVQGALEDLRPDATYDLVFAAAALHWTEPTGRWSRVCRLLSPGGTFAAFGGQLHLADPTVEAAVRAARSPYLEDDSAPAPRAGTHGLDWPGDELVESGLFDDVRESIVARPVMLSAADYLGHLSTISAYLALPDEVRSSVFTRIGEVLPDQVALDGDLTLHLARSRPSAGPEPGQRPRR